LKLTTKCGCAWQRRNLVSILFVPENRHTYRINFFKATLLAVSVPRIFFVFLVRRKLKKFENHWFIGNNRKTLRSEILHYYCPDFI